MPDALCSGASLDDGEFWDLVLLGRRPDDQVDDYDPDDDPNVPDLAEYEMEQRLATPCPECGQVGACAYDTEGRALIHATTGDDT